MTRAVFLDRDGVINELVYYEEAGIIDSPFIPEQFRLRPGAAEGISLLNQHGLKIVVVSNQPGVAKEHFSLQVLEAIDRKMRLSLQEKGAVLDAVYYCLHHPQAVEPAYKVSCLCRKPEPGLVYQAARELSLDLSHSYMVGDNLSDVLCGQKAGCRTILIGNQRCELCHLMEAQGVRPQAVVSDLLEAARTILKWEANHGSLC